MGERLRDLSSNLFEDDEIRVYLATASFLQQQRVCFIIKIPHSIFFLLQPRWNSFIPNYTSKVFSSASRSLCPPSFRYFMIKFALCKDEL